MFGVPRGTLSADDAHLAPRCIPKKFDKIVIDRAKNCGILDEYDASKTVPEQSTATKWALHCMYTTMKSGDPEDVADLNATNLYLTTRDLFPN